MKKSCSVILALVLLLTLCACGNSEEAGTPPETSSDSAGSAFADIGSSNGDFSFTIEPIGEVPTNVMDFDPPSYEYDFTIEPVTVSSHGISFEFADYQFSFDESTFDAKKFTDKSSKNFSDKDKAALSKMQAKEVMAIAETRANLLGDLSHAFRTSGLDVTVDEENGEIMLDSSVLFEVDKSDISPEGQEFLRKFVTVYTTVVFHEKYEGFVSRILVEGHTDSNGGYDYNLTLSQERADSVKEFCLSEESGADAYIGELEGTLEAVGHSYDQLIYDESGKEDSAASRRVSFRFLISLP